MNKIGKTLLPVTTVLVLSTAAYAQDAVMGAEAESLQDSIAPAVKVIRYSAGDSIVLGHAVQAKALPMRAKELPIQAQAVRYSAGDSIALDYPQRAGEADARPQAETAGFSTASRLPLVGALADSVTTHIGLNQSGIAEKNTLVNTSPAGLVGLFVVKAGLVYYFEHQTPAIRKTGLKATAGVWNGVALNNLLLIGGASNPISLLGGALFGAFMYHQQGALLEKQDSAKNVPQVDVQAR